MFHSTRLTLLLTVCLVLHSLGWAGGPPCPPRVDLARFQGCWYEVARAPNVFQRRCQLTTAEYRLLPNGQLQVINRCQTCRGRCKSLKGRACTTNPPCNNRLIVSFPVPFGQLPKRLGRANYFIHYVSPNYDTAVVGTPQRGLFWVLSRDRQLCPAELQRLLGIARRCGYDTSMLVM